VSYSAIMSQTAAGPLVPSSSPSANSPPMSAMSDFLTAHNMRRLLDAYRTLAPLTIGGPASTSLETSPAGLLGSAALGRPVGLLPEPLGGRRPGHQHHHHQHQQQQQHLLLLQHSPQHYNMWQNGGVAAACGRIEDGRRRHSSCSSLAPAPHLSRTLSSPHSSSSSPTASNGESALFPVFSPKDSETSRSAGLQQRCCNNSGGKG